ncbi:hypothetical protein ACQKPE_19960 [Pseudomonas sp. NPDC089554]|uniref:hypothetical protein n=1 Tax=Pseudomonas sp. NPDC089554 TaxID=3390653 RepID=UPI003D090319
MSSTQTLQIFIDYKDKDSIAPDASAAYELTLSEKVDGWGAAKGKSIMHPVMTIKHNGALALPQTFSFVIDGTRLKAGNRYDVSLRYKATTDGTQGTRLEWAESFVLQPDSRIVPESSRGHGPCRGRTRACLGW